MMTSCVPRPTVCGSPTRIRFSMERLHGCPALDVLALLNPLAPFVVLVEVEEQAYFEELLMISHQRSILSASGSGFFLKEISIRSKAGLTPIFYFSLFTWKLLSKSKPNAKAKPLD